MENELEKNRKLIELCTKIAEINCVLSATGATIIDMNYDSLNMGSLISYGALGINLVFLSYDAYHLYQLDKQEYNSKEEYSKRLVKIKKGQIKESNQM